jgi:hypothetical protein
MTLLAAAFTVLSMAAAFGRHEGFGVRIFGALGMGTIMLGALFAPGFSHGTASSLTLVLLVPIVGIAAAFTRRTRHPTASARTRVVAVTLTDIAFMALLMFLMPPHGEGSVAPLVASGTGLHVAAAHSMMPGGLMLWLALLVWAACAAVLLVPGLRAGHGGSIRHAVCSAGMIAAMAAMAA